MQSALSTPYMITYHAWILSKSKFPAIYLLSYPVPPAIVTGDVLISHCNLEWVLSLPISFLNAACDQS